MSTKAGQLQIVSAGALVGLKPKLQVLPVAGARIVIPADEASAYGKAADHVNRSLGQFGLIYAGEKGSHAAVRRRSETYSQTLLLAHRELRKATAGLGWYYYPGQMPSVLLRALLKLLAIWERVSVTDVSQASRRLGSCHPDVSREVLIKWLESFAEWRVQEGALVTPNAAPRRLAPEGRGIEAELIEVLRVGGRPMQRRELLSEMRKRGLSTRSLDAVLRGSGLIKRVSRATYALAGGPET